MNEEDKDSCHYNIIIERDRKLKTFLRFLDYSISI